MRAPEDLAADRGRVVHHAHVAHVEGGRHVAGEGDVLDDLVRAVEAVDRLEGDRDGLPAALAARAGGDRQVGLALLAVGGGDDHAHGAERPPSRRGAAHARRDRPSAGSARRSRQGRRRPAARPAGAALATAEAAGTAGAAAGGRPDRGRVRRGHPQGRRARRPPGPPPAGPRPPASCRRALRPGGPPDRPLPAAHHAGVGGLHHELQQVVPVGEAVGEVDGAAEGHLGALEVVAGGDPDRVGAFVEGLVGLRAGAAAPAA